MDSKFLELLGGVKSPWFGRISAGAERGELVTAETDEHPALEVVNSDVKEVRSLSIQVVKVRNVDTGEEAYVRRCVADIGDGIEMDVMDPIAIDATLAESGVDVSKCAACQMKIHGDDLVSGHAVINDDGQAYHAHCLS